jgi:DNA helicase-2/ATP-dependent DNA helicase PcrA
MYGSWVNSLPSRFVEELPEEHITVQAEMGLYSPDHAEGRSSHWDSSGFSGKTREPSRIHKVSAEGFQNGDRVFHEKFGNGTVIYADGKKLDIAFDHAGQKRVMDSFIVKA